jgi:hypothetical protein
VVLQGRALEWAHCGGQARGHSRRGSAKSLDGFNN